MSQNRYSHEVVTIAPLFIGCLNTWVPTVSVLLFIHLSSLRLRDGCQSLAIIHLETIYNYLTRNKQKRLEKACWQSSDHELDPNNGANQWALCDTYEEVHQTKIEARASSTILIYPTCYQWSRPPPLLLPFKHMPIMCSTINSYTNVLFSALTPKRPPKVEREKRK